VDAAVDQLKTETDPAKRRALTKEVLTIHQADVGHLPLHHQVIPWAMRSNVAAVHRADNRLNVKWVTIK
jgi:peptide/nickel transport system substrate-binding protein